MTSILISHLVLYVHVELMIKDEVERRHAGQFSLEPVCNPPRELRAGVIFSNGMHLEMEREFEEAAMKSGETDLRRLLTLSFFQRNKQTADLLTTGMATEKN